MKFIYLIVLFLLFGCRQSSMYTFSTSSFVVTGDTTDQLDSIILYNIRPGVYYRYWLSDTLEKDLKVNIEWIYVTKSRSVKVFKSSDLKSSNTNLIQNPKRIRHWLKQNHGQIKDINYLNSEIKNKSIITINSHVGDFIDSDELLFLKDGLCWKIRNYNELLSMNEYLYLRNSKRIASKDKKSESHEVN